MEDFDESGWWAGRIEPWTEAEAWTLFAREDDSRMVQARWRQQAERFFRAEVSVSPVKRYPGGGQPRFDRARIGIGPVGAAAGQLIVQTFPVDAAAGLRAGALAVADRGMDALVARSPRVWQWRASEENADPRAELRLAAVLASVLLGPVWAPGEDEVFGVRGARLRLERN